MHQNTGCQENLWVSHIQLRSFGSDRLEPSGLVLGFGDISFLHTPSMNTSASWNFCISLVVYHLLHPLCLATEWRSCLKIQIGTIEWSMTGYNRNSSFLSNLRFCLNLVITFPESTGTCKLRSSEEIHTIKTKETEIKMWHWAVPCNGFYHLQMKKGKLSSATISWDLTESSMEWKPMDRSAWKHLLLLWWLTLLVVWGFSLSARQL